MDHVRCMRRIREVVADLGHGHGRENKSIVLGLTADGDLEREIKRTRFVMFPAFGLRLDTYYSKVKFRCFLIQFLFRLRR